MNITSGRPAARYGVVGEVLLSTAWPRIDAAGKRYTLVETPMPLASGMNDTACAPTLLVLTQRSARKLPSASSASSARDARSRACSSLRNASCRSQVHLTGRRTRRAAQATSANSG